jgi:hypothetical protein
MMKKPIKYKRFLIIFGATIVLLGLLYAAWIGAKTIFPLPPENGITISQREIFCFSKPLDIYGHGSSFFAPLGENRFVITDSTIPGYYEDPRYSDICIVNLNGETEKQTRIDFDITGVYGFENGNFGVIISDLDPFLENKEYFLREYNTDFEIISENPLPTEMLGEINYANGTFYSQSAEAIYSADREMRNLITYDIPRSSEEEKFSRYLMFSYDNSPYLFTVTRAGDTTSPESDQYYIETLDGERAEVIPDENSFLLFYSTFPGDARYDFFTMLYNNATIDDPIFGEITDANYIVGINKDGTLHKLYIEDYYDLPSELFFRYAVPVGDKRYYLYVQNGPDELQYIYLIEYSTVYED